jgi:RNA polymerase sigma-70 factor (ECF subfamily)
MGMSAEREHLLDAVAGGEGRAFARLAGPYREELHGFAVRMVGGDAGLGEEVTQEALLRAYRAICAGSRPENVRAWLYAIVRNAALNALRSRRATLPLSESGHAGPHDEATRALEVSEWMDWLMGAIVALPPRQRDALVASAFEGRSQREIAAGMGTSVPAVKTLLHRARRSLEAAQPSPLAALPLGVLALARRAAAHARGLLAAKLGTKGLAAMTWQTFLAATVATGVAIIAHGGAGPVPAIALTPRGGPHATSVALRARAARGHPPGGPQQLSPARVHSEARRALRECVMGHPISKKLSGDALLYASRHVPEDAREYTECEQVLRRSQLGRPLSGGAAEPARAGSRPRRPRPQGARRGRSHGRP